MNVFLMMAAARRLAVLVILWVGVVGWASAQVPAIEEVTVMAHPLSGEGLSQAIDVLQGEQLERNRATNIGDTLARLPGIHSAPFGNAVGRPVIHGLSGPRVRIMEDRIDTLDVSVSSGDHAVGVEPFVADRIEVLKGASTLLYGSGAIGGVVDVHTGRIPHAIPANGLTGGVETRFDENTDGNTTAVKLNGGKGRVAWHVDGTLKHGDDYAIPGFAESTRVRSQASADDGGARGTLPGSRYRTKSGAGGLSYIDDWGFIGASVSELAANYGLPGGHSHDDGDKTPTLEMMQTRSDMELGIKEPFARVSSINFRLGVNDYEHEEIEPSGEVATHFSNDAWESRLEAIYETRSWTHVLGVQHSDKQFSAQGEEAFIQPVDTSDSGVFWLGERALNGFDLELGARIGYLEHTPSVSARTNFLSYAVSAGVLKPLSDNWQLGVIADYSSRAPVAEELYADGPHLVTQTFEQGNAELDSESALNLSATIQYTGRRWSATATGYYTQFYDFIYQRATAVIEEDLPVVEYRQDDAYFVGVDLEVAVTLAAWSDGEWVINGVFDAVDAALDIAGNDALPRTPPTRYGAGFDVRWRAFSGSIDYLRVDAQNDVAELELNSGRYNDLSAYLGVERPVTDRVLLSVFLHGKNLTNDEQRVHTSFIKDFAPAPGRTIETGLRLVF